MIRVNSCYRNEGVREKNAQISFFFLEKDFDSSHLGTKIINRDIHI